MPRSRGRLAQKRAQSRFTMSIRKHIPSNKSLNEKIKKIQRNTELKFNDTEFADTASDDGLAILLVNGIDQGVQDTQRIGDELDITSMQFRMTITTDAGRIGPSIVRCIAFWDKQANGAVPITSFGVSALELLDGNTIAQPYLAPINYSMVDRYRIVYDKTFTLRPDMAATTTPASGVVAAVVPVSMTIKGKIKLGRKVKYIASSGGIVDIGSNSLYFVWYTSNGALTQPAIDCATRCYFKDS